MMTKRTGSYEAQRLWPVAAQGSIRTLTTPVDLGGGVAIPKGATCFISLLAIQRAANVKRVGEFLPGRWLEKEPEADGFEDPNISFFPFSLGVRNCVGQNLASAQLRSVLAALATRFEFALQTPPTPEFFLTLKPGGARITVEVIK
jgi:cytochrome P450